MLLFRNIPPWIYGDISMPAVRLVTLCVFLPAILFANPAVAAIPVVVDESVESAATKAARVELQAAEKQKQAAAKQMALKTAAIDVAKKRAIELEQQLKVAQERIAAETKALQAAEVQRKSAEAKIASVTEVLDRNLEVDALVAVASKAHTALQTAENAQAELEQQLAALKNEEFEQQQVVSKATSDLKSAQEQLPKTMEELKKARTAFDEASRAMEPVRGAVAAAQKAAKDSAAAIVPERIRHRRATQALDQVNATVKSLQDSLATIRAATQLAEGNPDAAGAELVKSIENVTLLQQRAAELVSVAAATIADKEKQHATADAALAAAQTEWQEKRKLRAEASRAHFALQLSVADLQSAEKLHDKQIADANSRKDALVAEQKELEPRIQQAAAEVAKLLSDYVGKQKLAESAMEPLGRFVSFSRHIAPIFAKRCVACHNTRTASGRFNMNTFAAMAKGGESGPAIEAHDAESSLLWMMISDGTMPKDADPLTKEEIELVGKWIQLGTPLDAGVVATAELFQVMPEIPQPLPPETYRVPIPVTATAFNADASLLASSGYHEILIWKTADGSLVRRISNVAERVYDLEFSADGAQLAVAAGTPGQLGEVKLFTTADGKHEKTLVRTRDAVFAVSYSPDGTQVAAAGADRVVYVVDLATGDTKLQIEDHADWVMDVNWSPDGTHLVTSSRDKTAKVFEVATGRSVITFNGHGDAVYSAAFLADGASIVSAGSDKQVRIWNVKDAKETRKIGGFGSDIFRVVVTPDNHVLTASADRNAREHNLADGKSIRTFAGHKDWVYTLCYNPQQKLIATGSYDGEVRVWNSSDGSMATSFIAVPKASDATVADASK